MQDLILVEIIFPDEVIFNPQLDGDLASFLKKNLNSGRQRVLAEGSHIIEPPFRSRPTHTHEFIVGGNTIAYRVCRRENTQSSIRIEGGPVGLPETASEIFQIIEPGEIITFAEPVEEQSVQNKIRRFIVHSIYVVKERESTS